MPGCKSSVPHEGSPLNLQGTTSSFRPHPRRPGWTTATIARVHLPVHDCGSLHPMARSHSIGGYDYSLRARLTGPNWVDELPWVLLGIRTAPKEDLASSLAELVYGAPLTVPGEFFPSSTEAQEPNKLLTALRAKVKNFAPIPTSRHGLPHASVPSDLKDSQFIFIRRDAHRSPLQRPYEGPFKVLEAGAKSFTIDKGGRPELITVDRLKPAHQYLLQR